MQTLLGNILRWLVRHLISLALIIAILLVGRVGWSEWQSWRSTNAASALLDDAIRESTVKLEKLAQQAHAGAATLRTASLGKLDARIAKIDAEISGKKLKQQQLGGLAMVFAGQSIAQSAVQALQIEGEIRLLQQEREWLVTAKDSQQLSADRERLRQVHVKVYGEWQAVSQELRTLEDEHKFKSLVPGTGENKRRTALEKKQAQLRGANEEAHKAYQRQHHRSKDSGPRALPTFDVDKALSPLRALRSEVQEFGRATWVGKAWGPVREVLPSALVILLGAILTPIAIKALFYFVLAPAASRRPPVQLLPNAGGELMLEAGTSSMSRAVTVDSEHELLVHPEFLQSTSETGDKTTQWLLNWRFPLTSLSAGMVALTRIRSETPASFTISATHDALAEIGVLNLPAGSAVVMQPHNLVGVVQERDRALRITAHWRLLSLHAWLTLQLRYLALHGPVKLIVQGCRGVQLERADGGRAINQSATIAFSANLAYSTRRCETFAAYLLGQQELLNDCFDCFRAGVQSTQEIGSIVYQQVPNAGRKTGITGRGLEGLSDSVLKVLGV